MPIDVLIGAQWGDEGKGKISTVMSRGAYTCARFQGGPNAGHTTYIGSTKLEFRTLPAGTVTAEFGLIGNGAVVYPRALLQELAEIKRYDPGIMDRILISSHAHVITEEHLRSDQSSHSQFIGTTRRGVGPAYSSKVSRTGLRVVDLLASAGLKHLPSQDRDAAKALIDLCRDRIIDTGEFLRTCLKDERRIVAEGAQGTFLDVDHGDYPYVTSSNTTIGGVFTGLGVGFKEVDNVLLAASAYLTKLGSGPFPTRLEGPIAHHIQTKGREYDAARGEMRACGWIDIMHIRRAAALNCATGVVVTKLDVLSGLAELQLHDTENKSYVNLEGWTDDLTGLTTIDQMPRQALDYISAIADLSGIQVVGISTGPQPHEYISCNVSPNRAPTDRPVTKNS